MDKITILGGRGFIGSEIAKVAKDRGYNVWIPDRNNPSVFDDDLGVVIYCVGNGDCNNTPFSVYEANTNYLSKVLLEASFSRLLYMSSTRVYMNQRNSEENTDINISNLDTRRLFNLTKLLSEELCIKSGRETCIVRPSNVYGVALDSPLFLPSITRDALLKKKVNMFVSPDYSKDYVSVTDVAHVCLDLIKLDNGFSKEIYNIASGVNVSAKEIADILVKYTGCEVVWHTVMNGHENFPETSINKIISMFEYNPQNVLRDLRNMIDSYKISLSLI